MSKYAGHTPGPLTVTREQGDGWWFGDSDEWTITDAHGNTLAVMGDIDGTEANFRLYADAPTLLRQRNALLEAAKKVCRGMRETDTGRGLIELDAAIAACEADETK